MIEMSIISSVSSDSAALNSITARASGVKDPGQMLQLQQEMSEKQNEMQMKISLFKKMLDGNEEARRTIMR